jgi:hypothetical protein
MRKARSLAQVNAAIAQAGGSARLIYSPRVRPELYFVNIGERGVASTVTNVSHVSARTIEEWLEQLKVAEVCEKRNPF